MISGTRRHENETAAAGPERRRNNVVVNVGGKCVFTNKEELKNNLFVCAVGAFVLMMRRLYMMDVFMCLYV